MKEINSLPRSDIHIDCCELQGPLEWWRHTFAHSGINPNPRLDRIIEAAAKFKPRMLRIQLQEYFFFYPEHGRFDWSRLDPYMDSVAKTGAKVVCSIMIKLEAVFEARNPVTCRPKNVEEWQNVVYQLVKRYGVDRPLMTHWKVANETDIGEIGGGPQFIPNAQDYHEFYKMTIKPILEACPYAKVGGPVFTSLCRAVSVADCPTSREAKAAALAMMGMDLFPEFVRICHEEGTQLDFVSWHIYDYKVEKHIRNIQQVKSILTQYPGKRPEMMITEWSTWFDAVSVEELAFDPSRAAMVASTVITMLDEGLDWLFYFHILDQIALPDTFMRIMAVPDVMYDHWNQTPHRLGIFGVDERARPQYFVYQMLTRMGDRRTLEGRLCV